MQMGKRIVGTFHSEQDLLNAIEGLKRQGYLETDMMVVAKSRSDIPLVSARTGVMVEAEMQVNTLTGVMVDSLFTMMTGGMGGNHARTLADRLIGRGIPEFTAKQCDAEVNKGQMVLLVDTNTAYNSPVTHQIPGAQYESDEQRAVRLREEQLEITKERVQIGELQLRKEIIEEQRTVHVPLMREEVYVERRPVVDGKYDGSPLREDEIIRIPIIEERIEVTKRPVVVEEVIVGKRKIQETKQVQDTIRKEEARIERSIPSIMDEVKMIAQITNVEQQEVSKESPKILVVEGNPDIASLLPEDKKEEPRAKRSGSVAIQEDKSKSSSGTGSVAVQEEKDKPDSSRSKKADVSGISETETNNITAASASNKKEDASLKNENSSSADEDKNSKTQMDKKKK